jgi:hypothetical protein
MKLALSSIVLNGNHLGNGPDQSLLGFAKMSNSESF